MAGSSGPNLSPVLREPRGYGRARAALLAGQHRAAVAGRLNAARRRARQQLSRHHQISKQDFRRGHPKPRNSHGNAARLRIQR
jgi:hypothetical protein